MTPFTSNMTLRWTCRAGDYVLWGRFQGIMSPAGKEYSLASLWEMQDGTFLNITNRADDLPAWFRLHPTEASGRLVSWMMEKLAGGYDLDEPLVGYNLWRVFAGDRIARVGPERDGVEATDGALTVVEFRENALVWRESADGSELKPGFATGTPSAEVTALCNAGWKAIRRPGVPRVAAADDQWSIG
jgi:hypothetical protein